MITSSEFDRVAQNAHLLFGMVAILVPAHLFTTKLIWLYALLFTIYAAWKEFYYDVHYERAEVRLSGLKDFIYYELGIAIGILIILL